MSTLLILLVLAVATYLAVGVARGPRRERVTGSVTEFNRALQALDPHRRPRRRRGQQPPQRAARSRRPAA